MNSNLHFGAFVSFLIVYLCALQEDEIQSVRREIQQIADGNGLDDDSQLNELIMQNTKLKHRLIILNKVI